jgi:predicted chitinase
MAEGQKFKTGFLAPNIDYGAIGKAVGETFINPIKGVLAERDAERKQLENSLGIGTAAITNVPGQIAGKYKDGVQLALDEWMKAEVAYEGNKTQENMQKLARQKSQYENMLQDAQFGSQTLAKSMLTVETDPRYATNREEAMQYFEEFSKAPNYSVSPDGVIMVGEEQYFNSTITASNAANLPVPPTIVEDQFKHTFLEVAKQSDTAFKAQASELYEYRQVGNKMEMYELKGDKFDEMATSQYNNYINVIAPESVGTIKLHGYKAMHRQGDQQITQGELDRINDLMPDEAFTKQNEQGKTATSIKFVDGKPQFDLSIEDAMALHEGSITEDKLEESRDAAKIHAQGYYDTQRSVMPAGMKSAIDAATTPTADIKDVFGGQYENLPDGNRVVKPTADAAIMNWASESGINPETDPLYDLPLSTYAQDVVIDNQKIKTQDAILDADGNVKAYRINVNTDLLDKLVERSGELGSSGIQLQELLGKGSDIVDPKESPDLFNSLNNALLTQEQKNKATPNFTQALGMAQLQLGVVVTPADQDAINEAQSAQPAAPSANPFIGPANKFVVDDDAPDGEDGMVVDAPSETVVEEEEEKPMPVQVQEEEAKDEDFVAPAVVDSEEEEMEDKKVIDPTEDQEDQEEGQKTSRVGDFFRRIFTQPTPQDATALADPVVQGAPPAPDMMVPGETEEEYLARMKSQGVMTLGSAEVPSEVPTFQEELKGYGLNDIIIKSVEAATEKESGGRRDRVEDATYKSVKRILEVFGYRMYKEGLALPVYEKNDDGSFKLNEDGRKIVKKYVPKNDAAKKELKQLVKNGPALFEKTYGYKGNYLGNDKPGDGYKYRGRTYIQLTGKANYKAASKALFGDERLVDNPDLVLEPGTAERVTSWFINKNYGAQAKEMGIDIDNMTQAESNVLVYRTISGGKDPFGYRVGKEGLRKMDEYTGVER